MGNDFDAERYRMATETAQLVGGARMEADREWQVARWQPGVGGWLRGRRWRCTVPG